ncbi:MAG: ATP-dependent helicase [Rhodospirillaceae bacterium]|nr:ATP-dependent helicase [Rhodospirillaceae bacterium]
MAIKLTTKQRDVLTADGHLLVTGGPGSGKTTISIMKAAQAVDKDLSRGQRVLFLSFTRATVSRVVEAIQYEHQLPPEQRKRIEVETYHSFFWRIIRAHGYLLGLPRRLTLLPPPAEAIALSSIRNELGADSKLSAAAVAEKQRRVTAERERLAMEEGRVCFDLFARYTGAILHGSERIRQLVSNMVPVIVLDEFQDTNADQWNVVQALGRHSRLIALADPEQRIYDFQGADPERLNHFREGFVPTEIDLSDDNHRSAGTEIGLFGNEILRGRFTQEKYVGVCRFGYPPNGDQAFTELVMRVYKARSRLAKSSKKDWSLAILVPTKKMTRLVADKLREPPAGMTAVPHSAVVELEGAILGAELIAFLLQPSSGGRDFGRFLDLLCNYFQGRGGDEPGQGDLNTAQKFRDAYADYVQRQTEGKAMRGSSLLVSTLATYQRARALGLTGDPDVDWRSMRSLLENGECSRLQALAHEVRNLRLLDRGTQLRQGLADDWRTNGSYSNALSIVKHAFVQEHFATIQKPETGVIVMNMHKAKGKQFDEVIIFEGWPRLVKWKIVANLDRIVRSNDLDYDNDQSRQNLRVSVTRGKSRTTILTPKNNPCVLLLNRA